MKDKQRLNIDHGLLRRQTESYFCSIDRVDIYGRSVYFRILSFLDGILLEVWATFRHILIQL